MDKIKHILVVDDDVDIRELLSQFLQKHNYLITKIESVDENISYEKNIYFQRNNFKNEFKINTKYRLRFFNRIISDKVNMKDKFLNLFSIY